jgi:putative SOS response-associated peptidase YedK
METCTIQTTAANDLIGSIHNRMPVTFDAISSQWSGKKRMMDEELRCDGAHS